MKTLLPAILEERMKNLIEENTKQHTLMMKKIDEVCVKLEDQFVSKDRFAPVEKLVYSLVGLILSSVVIGLLMLLFKFKL